jgi:hypothetical protein
MFHSNKNLRVDLLEVALQADFVALKNKGVYQLCGVLNKLAI